VGYIDPATFEQIAQQVQEDSAMSEPTERHQRETVQTTRQDADWYAERICESWRSTVQGIIDTGKRIAEAKAALEHGEFGRMVKEQLPFSWQWASKLCKIGEDARLQNLKSTLNLPGSVETLHAVATLPDDTFNQAVEDGTIYPDVKRSEIKKLSEKPMDLGEQTLELDEALNKLKRYIDGVLGGLDDNTKCRTIGSALREWGDEIDRSYQQAEHSDA
jgi:hypothetical protein